MHTVELLEQALNSARELGYIVREEWLGGTGGGSCAIKGRKHLFVDLTLSPRERLERVLEQIAASDEQVLLQFPQPLRGLVNLRRSA